MTWPIFQRLLNGFFTLLGGLTAIIVTTQNTSLSQTHLVWMGIVCAFSSTTVAVLPSLFGVSGLAPKREETVVREVETRAVVRGMAIARGSEDMPQGGRL
jgi:hypothetical protein